LHTVYLHNQVGLTYFEPITFPTFVVKGHQEYLVLWYLDITHISHSWKRKIEHISIEQAGAILSDVNVPSPVVSSEISMT